MHIDIHALIFTISIKDLKQYNINHNVIISNMYLYKCMYLDPDLLVSIIYIYSDPASILVLVSNSN